MLKISDKIYDITRWVAQYLLPAIGTLYFTLSEIWKLPFSEEILGTIMAVDTFLGVFLGIDQMRHKGGKVYVEQSRSETKR